MKIEHDGVHWHGTFDVVLQALFDDLLPDGPVLATITFLDEDDENELTIVGIARELTHTHLMLDLGAMIQRDRILAVEV